MNLAPKSPEAQEFGAVALPGSGDIKRAESLMQDLQKCFPFHTILQSCGAAPTAPQMGLHGAAWPRMSNQGKDRQSHYGDL
jgi:hypothetical protein